MSEALAKTFICHLNEPRYLMRPGALAAASQWPGIRYVEEIGVVYAAPDWFFEPKNDNGRPK